MVALFSRSIRSTLGSVVAVAVCGPVVGQSDADPVPAEVVVDANSEQGVEPGGGPPHWTLLRWNGGRLDAARELWISTGYSTSTFRLRAEVGSTVEMIVEPRAFANAQVADSGTVFFVGDLAGATHLWVFEPQAPQKPVRVLDSGGQPIAIFGQGMLVDHGVGESSAYFAATDAEGTELWRAHAQTQGTPPVTTAEASRLHDLWSGGASVESSEPEGFVRSGRRLFFAATSPLAGMPSDASRDLRVLDLDDPTTAPARIGVGGTGPRALVAASDRGVFFLAQAGTADRVFFSDGATVVEVPGQTPYSEPSALVWLSHPTASQQERLFFIAANGNGDRALWRFDPDDATPSAREVTSGDADPSMPTAFRNRLFFLSGGELWTVNRSGNARKFWDLEDIDLIQEIFATERTLFLVRSDSSAAPPRSELWCVSRGMSLLAEIPGAVSDLVSGGDRLFFRQTVDGREEIWVSFGTRRQTRPILASLGSEPSGFAAVGDRLVFAASGSSPSGRSLGREPWVLDSGGGRMLRNLRQPDTPLPRSSDPSGFTRSGAFVYFVADDGTHGRELWVTDGDELIERVTDIKTGAASSRVRDLTAFDGGPYFVASDGRDATLWAVTEPPTGTTAWTVRQPKYEHSEFGDPRALTVIEHAAVKYLFFTATTGEGDSRMRQAFVTNGTKIGPLGFGSRVPADCSFAKLEDAVNGASVIFAAEQAGRGAEPCRVTFADIVSRLN